MFLTSRLANSLSKGEQRRQTERVFGHSVSKAGFAPLDSTSPGNDELFMRDITS